jgi:CDP-diacylglycerol---serine O-phosphatidyltransferase
MTDYSPHEPRPEAPAEQPVRGRRGIYILPNLFTTAGLFAGFFAIVQATKGQFESAAVAIFVAMIMDTLDGRVARMTNTASDFGKEYDSLVDVIAFGLSPALVMYAWALSSVGRIGWLVAFIYVAATALRLARFNTVTTADKRYFQGLPCPAAAAVIAATVWLVHVLGIDVDWFRFVALALTVALSLAMVSNVKYRSFKDLDLRGRVPFVALVAVVLVFVLISFDPPLVLFAFFFGYFLSGPATWLIRWRRRAHGSPTPAERSEERADDSAKGHTDDDRRPPGA